MTTIIPKRKNLFKYLPLAFRISFVICQVISVCLNAQVHDTANHSLKYLALGSLSKTNDGKTWLINNAVNYSIKKNKNAFNFNAGWIYSNFNQELTNNDFTSSLDFDLYKTFPRFYYWGLATFDKSYSLRIINRLQGGAGGAYNVYDTKPFQLNVSDGILYEYSDLYLNDTSRETYNTFRNSLRLSYQLNIKDFVILEGQHFFQNSLNESSDYIIKSSSSLSIRLRKWISITASFLYNKINRTQRENLLLTYGVTIEKKF